MKIKFPNLVLFLFLILFSSCTRNQYFANEYYASDEGNILRLSQRNDLKVAGSIQDPFKKPLSPVKNINTNFQIGYSPIKHIGVFASHYHFHSSRLESALLTDLKINNLALGGYYFVPLPFLKTTLFPKLKNEEPVGILLDVYGGYGEGALKNLYRLGDSKFQFQKHYLQGGVHYQGKFMSISYTYRHGNLNYFEGVISGRVSFEGQYLQNIMNTRTIPLREDSFKFSFGLKQFNFYFSLSNNNFDIPFNLPRKKRTNSFGLVISVEELFSLIKK